MTHYTPLSIAVFFAMLLIFAGCTNGNADPDPAPGIGGDQYLQISSAVDQVEGTFKAEIIDAQSGIDYDVGNGQVTVAKAGAYFVVFAPQTSDRAECGNYWLTLNGPEVDNSNIRVCQTDIGVTTVAVMQAILVLEKGDILTFEMSGPLGTDATKPDNEPLIPSAIISVFGL